MKTAGRKLMVWDAACGGGGLSVRAALLLTLFLITAGCLGGDEPAEEAAVAASTPTNADASAGTASAPEENATLAEPVAVPVSYSGSTPTGACAFPVGQCHWTQSGSEDYHAIEASGRATRISVSIAYADQAPGMQFYVALCRGEGADESTVTCEDYQTAPSPILLDLDLSADPAGTSYGLSVGSVSDAAGATGAGMVFGPSTFDVEGVLTVLRG